MPADSLAPDAAGAWSPVTALSPGLAEWRSHLNALLLSLHLGAWKPALTALLLPPVPMLALIVVGARLILPRRGLGWSLVAVGVSALWLSNCLAVGDGLERAALHEPPALTPASIDALRVEAAAGGAGAAIVVLGSGREGWAPEYAGASLTDESLQRLRYGEWLGRRTRLPLLFSGGSGWAQDDGPAEADIAARIAAEEFGRPLRWVENRSRDTRENAVDTLALLWPAGIRHVIVVTDGWHMPRALRDFGRAGTGMPGLRLDAAPMGLAREQGRWPLLRWVPSSQGATRVRQVLREVVGLWMGA